MTFWYYKQGWMTLKSESIFDYLLSSHLQPNEQEQAGISGTVNNIRKNKMNVPNSILGWNNDKDF